MPSGSLKLRGRVRAVPGDNIDTDSRIPNPSSRRANHA